MQKTIRVISFQITSRAHSPGPFENHRDAKEEEGKLVLPSYVARERIYSYVSHDFPRSADLLNVRLSIATRSNTSAKSAGYTLAFLFTSNHKCISTFLFALSDFLLHKYHIPFWHIQICSWKYAFKFFVSLSVLKNCKNLEEFFKKFFIFYKII